MHGLLVLPVQYALNSRFSVYRGLLRAEYTMLASGISDPAGVILHRLLRVSSPNLISPTFAPVASNVVADDGVNTTDRPTHASSEAILKVLSSAFSAA
jgi:hypothetical protein